MAAIWIPILALFSLVFVSHNVFACDDVSTSACQKFAAQNPAMCDYGSCYATLCPRTCQKCASVTCYSCRAVARPENCNTTIECPSKDFKCILAKSYTDDFREVFGLGCALGNVCDSADNNTICCSTDLCNNNKTQPTTTTTAARKFPIRRGNKDKVVRQTAASCTDIHDDACRDLLSSDASICDTACAKSLCPLTCGACKQCYDCDYVSDSSQCNSTRVCQQGEHCYGIETINTYHEHGFRLGCAPDILCNKLTSMAVSTFGRKRALAGGCCDGNLCNDHLKAVTTTPTTTTTTTTTTTNDPLCQCTGTFYYQVNNECYFISGTEGTRQNGKDYCNIHCGQLATFTDPSKLSAVTTHYYNLFRYSLDPHSDHHKYHHHYDHVFVDAVKYHKSHTHPTYIWESTGRTVSSSFLNLHNVNSTYSDMCAVTSSLHSNTIQAEDCSDSHYALCQLRKQ
ncbi:uncharacterized protein LOC128185935 [Crassostrea angulata]|uniref:uncharacterized protein LOC128185935 n=1 Tax=Magallana angulata TaxID=2784310 RepID=UPI0022B082B2|nr:uncharacterized protein LOC128185935 [Crassostrea angulata]